MQYALYSHVACGWLDSCVGQRLGQELIQLIIGAGLSSSLMCRAGRDEPPIDNSVLYMIRYAQIYATPVRQIIELATQQESNSLKDGQKPIGHNVS